jgi:hypothetical protein
MAGVNSAVPKAKLSANQPYVIQVDPSVSIVGPWPSGGAARCGPAGLQRFFHSSEDVRVLIESILDPLHFAPRVSIHSRPDWLFGPGNNSTRR